MSLISGHSQAQTAYEPTLWAKLFHSVPHMNITFHQVDNRFNPENELYLEALGILASVPAAWLIATLVVLLIYLCTRCCDTKSTRRRKSRPLRCCLSFFALVTVAALAAGFWGNHVLHDGMVSFQRASESVDAVVRLAQKLARRYNEVFQKDVEQNLNKLYDGPFQRQIHEDPSAHLEIMDAADSIFYNTSEGLKAMDGLRFAIDEPNHSIDLAYIPFWASTVEKYRWPTTMALQSLFALFCLLLFVGAIIHSRCVLILFSVFGLFSIIFLWLLASVYTTTAVGLADFCHDPTPWVMHILQKTKVTKEISSYYLLCDRGNQSPFEKWLSVAQRAITDIDRRVRKISGTARKYYKPAELHPHLDDLEQSTEDTLALMEDLTMALRCQPIFRSYNTALVSLCDSGLLGVIVMLISCAVSGLLFTILVWCNSHTWIYFKHKGRYIKVDDADPYMPLSTIERPRGAPGLGSATLVGVSGPGAAVGSGPYGHRRNIHTPPQTPPYHGTLNGGHNGSLGITPPHAHSPYGHLGQTAQRVSHHNHIVGTLGRNGHHQHLHQPAYQGLDNLPASMTLGRRGHYGGLRGAPGAAARVYDEHGGGGGMAGGSGPASGPLMGAGVGVVGGGGGGQYATLSKQCKTLESSDFY